MWPLRAPALPGLDDGGPFLLSKCTHLPAGWAAGEDEGQGAGADADARVQALLDTFFGDEKALPAEDRFLKDYIKNQVSPFIWGPWSR